MALLVSQVALPPRAEASHLGSSTASAGSAPPPAVSQIQGFQPDLFTGRATTAIPIAVPPGRKGMQPGLALAYSSSTRNGWVGVGWSLELGSIERSTKRGVPTYDSSDTFLLVFQGVTFELVPTGANTYRAKDEGLFLRITFLGPSGWEVRDKSGTRYLFGGSPEAEQPGASGIFRWHLTKVIDTNQNYLLISYVQDQGQVYPYQIHYTGHGPSGLSPTNRVEFTLEPRTGDIETSSRSGARITTAKRLKEITVTASGQPVRTYRLSYITSPRTGRSLLTSVTQVGSDGVSTLPPATFTYQAATEPTYAMTSNTGLSGSKLWNVRYAGKDWGDLNGAVLYPSQITSWGETSPTYTQSSGSFGGFTYSIDSEGRISVGADRDMNMYFWTYVFVAAPRDISFATSQTEDSQHSYFLNGNLVAHRGQATLSLQQGWNLIEITSYNQNSGFSWRMTSSVSGQVDIMNPTQFLHPSLSGDFNGDGLTDLAFFDQPNQTWKVGISCGCTFQVDDVWLTGFGSTSDAPVLGDWDGDGRTDIATYSGGTWRFARSTGSGFQRVSSMDLSFGSGTPLIGDFNGDGTLDLATYSSGSWSVALGTGSGFNSTSSFNLRWGSSDDEPLTGDFNGDGLTDIGRAHRSTGELTVALSDGARFQTEPSAWGSGFGAAQEHLIADFNGDGMSDVAYYDRSSGQVVYVPSTGTAFNASKTKTVGAVFSMRDANDQVQVADYNGDGVADPAVFDPVTGDGQLVFSNAPMVDLLAEVANGLGGTLTLSYVPSGLLDNTGDDGLPDLPFVMPVVDKATLNDGMGHSYTTDYAYAGGRYEPADKEFRGFAEVTVRDPAGHKAVLQFHQDAQTKGRLQQLTVADKEDNVFSRQVNTWTCSTPAAGVSFCRLTRQVSATFDGDTTSREAAVSYAYDETTGNLLTITEEGDTGLSGDERITQVSYALNTLDGLVNRPASITVFDGDGVTKRKEQRFYYDHHPLLTDAPAQGNLTKVEEWLDATSEYLGTTLGYDTYGNVTSVRDPLGAPTSFAYDAATHTLVETLTNAAGHVQRLVRDVRFGTVTASTDPNGVKQFIQYDAFGRVTSTGVFDPTSGLPVVLSTTAYDLTTVPTKTQMTVYPTPTTPLITSQFTDGLGRTIQVRSPAEDPAQQVVDGVVAFDARGQVASRWLPYREAFSETYRAPSPVRPQVTYAYDPVGRPVRVTDPAGFPTAAAYDDWVVTVTDANSHRTRYTHDAHGRLTQVEEFNGTAVYETHYAYDALDRLLRVTDAAGNTTTMTYDSLDRKLSMDDPDMGRWTYAYDAVDNLTGQRDARGVTTTFTYADPLHRLTRKASQLPAGADIADPGTVTYGYDDPTQAFSKGQLTSITGSASSTTFTYDDLGRPITEEKAVGGTRYTFQAGFDLLDRLTSLTYPDGESVAYAYNRQGALERLASASATYVANADYNEAGQPTRLVLGSGVSTDYTYEATTLRLSHLTTRDAGNVALQDLAYTYDAVGNIKTLDDSAAGSSQAFLYDDLDRLIQASGPYGLRSYAYDALGNLTGKGSVTLTYGRPDGRQPHAVTSSSEGWSFAYDANGNMASRTSTAQVPEAGALTAKQFRFDAENRLVRVDVPATETVTVTFQEGWNFFALPVLPDRLDIASVFPTFGTTIDQVSRYNPKTGAFEHAVGHPKFDDFTTLEYGRGYEVYCPVPGGTTVTLTGALPTRSPEVALTDGAHLIGSSALEVHPIQWLLPGLVSGVDYDTVSRYDTSTGSLTTATDAQPAEAYFLHALGSTAWSPPLPRDLTTRLAYDATGAQTQKATAAASTTYVGDLYEVGPTGPTKHLFAGGLRIASRGSGGDVSFYHADHLGSTRAVTDGAGRTLGALSYTPFGEVVASSLEPPASSSFGFTGQREDRETGLLFYQARYYDPTLGRFLSADPLVQDPGDPQFLNRFAYVRNNPVRFIDPSGLSSEDPGCDALCQIIVIAGSLLASLFGRDEERPSLPPGPIFPTPFTPLLPLPGVSAAHVGQAAQGVGSFAADAFFNVSAFQDAATLLRVGSAGEKLLALGAMGIYTADVGLNLVSLGTKPLLTWAIKAGGKRALARELVPAAAKGVPRSRALIPRTFETLAPNGGRLGGFSTTETLQPGTLIDRFGPRTGRFVSPAGTPFSKRGLPPEAALERLETFKVIKPLQVEGSIASPAFGGGLGTQFRLPARVQELIDAGVLEVK